MSGNMQKKSKVASLNSDEELKTGESVKKARPGKSSEAANLTEDDPRYQTALKFFQHGNSPAKIADKLVKEGAFKQREDALLLAQRVSKENPQEQRTNAKILFGISAIFATIGLIFFAPDILKNGFPEFLQPGAIVFLLAGWFAYKGIQTWRSSGS